MERDTTKYYYRERIIKGKTYIEKTLKTVAKARANKRYEINPEAVKKTSNERYELKKDEINNKLKDKRIKLKADKDYKLSE